jgi:hypothetical protein
MSKALLILRKTLILSLIILTATPQTPQFLKGYAPVAGK